METSKTAPLSTSRLKWALEIVTASKNCHEEEPADNNENKSQPIIAKRLESSLELGFLIFVGSDISFSIAVSFAYLKYWMNALIIFRIGCYFEAHDSLKRTHHLKTEKECLTTILRRNSAGLGKTAHFSITVVGFSQIWKLKFGKELVSAFSQFFTKLADQELNPFSSLCHFLNRMLSQRKASESFLDNFDYFYSLPSIFSTRKGMNTNLGEFLLWIMEILRCCRLEGREATGCRGAYEPKKSRWGCDPTSTWSPQSFIARHDSREALFAVVVSENYQLSMSFQSFTMW